MTQGKIKKLLHYDYILGNFTHLTGPRTGKKAGSPRKNGHVYIYIKGKLYLAQRLAFLYMTGKWPKHQADHEDNNPSNNAWSNLRNATHAQNQHNKRKRHDNSTGFKWVRKVGHRYRGQVTVNNKPMYVGYFDTAYDAHLACHMLALRHHGKFARAI